MKIISGLFRFVALILMVVVIIGLPMAIFGNQVARPLLSAERMGELITPDLLARITVNQLEQRQLPASDNPPEVFVMQMLQQMSHGDWVAFYELVAPTDVMTGLTQQVVDGLQAWLDSGDGDIVIDLQPIKASISAQSQQVMSLVLGTLPGCTADQLAQMTAYTTGQAQDIPLCTPPEPFYGVMLDYSVAMLPAVLGSLPDDVDIPQGQLEINNQRAERLTRILRAGRLVLSIGWAGLLIIYLFAIPLGARTLVGVFNWAGWPSLLAGGHGLVLGLLLLFSHNRLSTALADVSGVNAQNALKLSFVNLINEAFMTASRPVLFAAGVMILWGVVALVLAALLGRTKAAA